MAVIIGNSGVWLDIVKKLKELDLYANTPGDIQPLMTRLCEEFEPTVATKRREVESRITEVRNKIVDLRLERGFVKVVMSPLKIVGHYFAIFRIRLGLRYFVAKLKNQLLELKRLLGSPELAGATAELAVIDILQKLPSDHVVINDVKLKAPHFIRFEGKPLQSAQIDHLVLSPAGVFVVETKCWSKGFAEHGNYHNPFDQVRRASYLCHVVLKGIFGSIKTRSIIACVGHLPSSNQPYDYVKVLRLHEINNYVTWFKKGDLSDETLSLLRNYLEKFVCRGNS